MAAAVDAEHLRLRVGLAVELQGGERHGILPAVDDQRPAPVVAAEPRWPVRFRVAEAAPEQLLRFGVPFAVCGLFQHGAEFLPVVDHRGPVEPAQRLFPPDGVAAVVGAVAPVEVLRGIGQLEPCLDGGIHHGGEGGVDLAAADQDEVLHPPGMGGRVERRQHRPPRVAGDGEPFDAQVLPQPLDVGHRGVEVDGGGVERPAPRPPRSPLVEEDHAVLPRQRLREVVLLVRRDARPAG